MGKNSKPKQQGGQVQFQAPQRKAKGQAKGQGKVQHQKVKQQKGGGKGQVQFQTPQRTGKGGGKGKGGKAVKQQAAGQHAQQYEKIPGTAIRMQKGGVATRVVHASGKEFSPNNIQGVWGHLEKLERSGQAGKGQSKGQRKGTGKAVLKTQVKQGKGGGKAPVKFKQGGFAATSVKKKNLKNGKGAGKGGKGRKGRKGKKQEREDLTPEEMAARKEKRAEKHATKIEKEMRMLVNDTYYTGEIVSSGKFFCWVLPQSPPIPASVMPELKKMNDEFRAKASQDTDGKKARGPFANGCEGNVVYIANDDIEEETLKPSVGTGVRFKLYTDAKGVGGCEVISA